MNRIFLAKRILALVLLSGLISCGNKSVHIYSDPSYRDQVEQKFESRKLLADRRSEDLFSVFEQPLTTPEAEGLKFLYAYMPLSDLADYDGAFFLSQVRWSIAARDAFSWGATVPEDLFRHFVLPYRVNNENLDTARIVIFNELKDRIRNLPMLDAALEVNHWCHEKVTYRGSDGRTSSPLASMRTAYGRCGEESTFTVAALRSVAIPARQVYTPRWAHSDDNHAWVEFWADGKWYYMGACEPECVPDLGWFTEPARRAMLIHTKAFGSYEGSERVENREPNFALLNTLTTYAPVKEIAVRIIEGGSPVSEATVEFQLYNYAEFYPLSVKKTDDNGLCNFATGLGDLLVWAYRGDRFGFRKITVAETDTLVISLDNNPIDDLVVEFDQNPPIQRDPVAIPNDCRERNNLLLRREDSIRAAYEATFRKEPETLALAATLGADPAELWNFIARSRGNYSEIEDFLESAGRDNPGLAMKLLALVSDKDLRDTRSDILRDHLAGYLEVNRTTGGDSSKDAAERTDNLLNPRVANEMLVAYRNRLLSSFGRDFAADVRNNPTLLTDWIRKEIRIVEGENYYNTPLSPVGVYNLRVADEQSRRIFAVACFRTFGVPSRLKAGTLEVEYQLNDQWNTIEFEANQSSGSQSSTLVLTPDPSNPVKLQYEIHYTLAQFREGKYHTLAYGYENLGDPLAAPLALAPGHYLLVTGNRMPGGKVLCSLTFFRLEPGATRQLAVRLRTSGQSAEVLAEIQPGWPAETLDGKPFVWTSLNEGGSAVLAWIEPDREPTKHIFQDLALLKKEIDGTGCPFVFMIPRDRLPAGFSPDLWKGLPESSTFLVVPDDSSLKELERSAGKQLAAQLPVVVRISQGGKVNYLSSGYKIGIGEDLVKILRQ